MRLSPSTRSARAIESPSVEQQEELAVRAPEPRDVLVPQGVRLRDLFPAHPEPRLLLRPPRALDEVLRDDEPRFHLLPARRAGLLDHRGLGRGHAGKEPFDTGTRRGTAEREGRYFRRVRIRTRSSPWNASWSPWAGLSSSPGTGTRRTSPGSRNSSPSSRRA